MSHVVTVTKKGQATIPKVMREKHKIGRKVLVIDTSQGVLLKPLPDPSMERGSLKREFKGYINLVTLSELFYILCRINEQLAIEKERNLRSFGIKVVSIRDKSKIWKEAASIKARHSLSLADAYGAATAITLKATLVTGSDIEFDKVKNLKVQHLQSL